MAKKMGAFDRATRDFVPYQHLHKVERERDRPYITDAALAFLTKKGVVKEEGGKTFVTLGVGWEVMGKVGTRAGRYILPTKDDPEDKG
jgi:hypothetical protein